MNSSGPSPIQRFAFRIGADRQIGDEQSAEPRVGGARQRVRAGRHERIEVAEQHERHARLRARHELEQPVEVHAALERALRARLDDRAVGHRIGERQAELDDVGAGVLQRVHQVDGALDVGVAGGDVRNQRAPCPRPCSSCEARRSIASDEIVTNPDAISIRILGLDDRAEKRAVGAAIREVGQRPGIDHVALLRR